MPEFWSSSLANQIVAERGASKVVFARNVIPHVSELHDVIKGIENKNKIKNSLKYYPRKLFFEDKQESYEMATDHFPGFKKEEIIKKINSLKALSDKEINLNYLSDNLIVVSS